MSQNSRNPNPVGFVADTRQLSHNREAAFGERRPHIVPLGYIPPFQIVRPLTSASTIVFSLYRYETNTEIYITFYMYQTGFQVWSFPAYKIWLYPGTIPLPLPSLNEGVYRMTITTGGGGGDVLTREDFCWKNESGMNGFVKMEWFHQRSLDMPFGKIIFEPPFKYWHWFDTELGKPSYQYERDVDVRDGIEYVNKIVSWKEQRFVTRGDENFIDALSLVPHMDTVVVTFLGDEINTFRVIVTPDWQERGDEALIEIEIRSNQVVVTNGDALDDFNYDVEQSQCLSTDLVAVAILDYLSTPYNLGLYQTPIGETVYLTAGQFVLVRGATTGFYSFISPGNYLFISIADDLVVYEANTGTYYVNDSVLGVIKPTIIDIDNSSPSAYVVTGVGLPGTFIEIFGRVDSSSVDEVLLAVGTNTEFGAGITFDPLGNKSFRVKCSTFYCKHFAISTWKTNLSGGGIGEGIIENTFQIG